MVGGVVCCKIVILWLGCHGNSLDWVSHVPLLCHLCSCRLVCTRLEEVRRREGVPFLLKKKNETSRCRFYRNVIVGDYVY